MAKATFKIDGRRVSIDVNGRVSDASTGRPVVTRFGPDLTAEESAAAFIIEITPEAAASLSIALRSHPERLDVHMASLLDQVELGLKMHARRTGLG